MLKIMYLLNDMKNDKISTESYKRSAMQEKLNSFVQKLFVERKRREKNTRV